MFEEVTVYFKEDVRTRDGKQYLARNLTLGPFHPVLGDVPPEATIQRTFHSSLVYNLLIKFELIAKPLLCPPTLPTTKETLLSIENFDREYRYIYHLICKPAEEFWSGNSSVPSIWRWEEEKKFDCIEAGDTLKALYEQNMCIQIHSTIELMWTRWFIYKKEWLKCVELEEILASPSYRISSSIESWWSSKPASPPVLPLHFGPSDTRNLSRYVQFMKTRGYCGVPVPSTIHPKLLSQELNAITELAELAEKTQTPTDNIRKRIGYSKEDNDSGIEGGTQKE